VSDLQNGVREAEVVTDGYCVREWDFWLVSPGCSTDIFVHLLQGFLITSREIFLGKFSEG
jgi:hypothetical protein